jgi:anti-sigma factor RsiW
MSERTASQSEDEPDDPREIELVAYLDGELDEQGSEQVERRLAADVQLRRKVDTLDRTWRLLDSLGEATASGEFTQKTISSLSTVMPGSEEPPAPLSKRFGAVLRSRGVAHCAAGFGLGFAGIALGVWLAGLTAPSEQSPGDERMLRELRLLKQYRDLRQVPDQEFLRELNTLDPDRPLEVCP